MKYTITVEGQTFTVEIENLQARPVIATVDGERFEVWPEHNNTAVSTPIVVTPKTVVQSNSNGGNSHNGNAVIAPIPGVIDTIDVKPGDEIQQGQTLCVLEAMKMKNQIRANRSGFVAAVNVNVGQQVNHGDVLLTYRE